MADLPLKVRIGVGLGTRTLAGGSGFGEVVDAMEDAGVDSLWLSEQLTGSAPDPLIALAVAAGRTRRLKLGTSVLVIPGRNPVVLAKEMASLDRLSGGRFLPAVGLGAPRPAEHRAFGVRREDRAALFEQSLGFMRRLWSGEEVDGVRIEPRPVQDPFDVWMGGRAPAELRRTGRLGDGWLPSFCTPAEVAAGWEVVTAAASAAGRSIDPQHLGALVAYSHDPLPDAVVGALSARVPGVDPAAVVPVGSAALRARLEEFISVGVSKFVALPVAEPTGGEGWRAELTALFDAVGDLQT